MDREKVASRNGKAFKTNEVKVNLDYIDARYELSHYPKNDITPSGLLTIGELKSRDKSLPEFLFRWDEKAESLDVDIINTPEVNKRKFKSGKEGYGGHHPKRIADEKNRTFEVDIKIPNFQVFKGKVSFGLHRELEVTVKSKASVSVSVEKKRGNKRDV